MIDKIKEILELAKDTMGVGQEDEDNLDQIIRICEKIIIDHKIEERLRLSELQK
jgi:hypothetical protein